MTSQHYLKEFISSEAGLYVFLNSMNNSIHKDIHQIASQIQQSLDSLRKLNSPHQIKMA